MARRIALPVVQKPRPSRIEKVVAASAVRLARLSRYTTPSISPGPATFRQTLMPTARRNIMILSLLRLCRWLMMARCLLWYPWTVTRKTLRSPVLSGALAPRPSENERHPQNDARQTTTAQQTTAAQQQSVVHPCHVCLMFRAHLHFLLFPMKHRAA